MILFISVAKTGFNLMQRLSKALMSQSPYQRGKIRLGGRSSIPSRLLSLNPLISGAKPDSTASTPPATSTSSLNPLISGEKSDRSVGRIHTELNVSLNPLISGAKSDSQKDVSNSQNRKVSIPLSAGQNPTLQITGIILAQILSQSPYQRGKIRPSTL